MVVVTEGTSCDRRHGSFKTSTIFVAGALFQHHAERSDAFSFPRFLLTPPSKSIQGCDGGGGGCIPRKKPCHFHDGDSDASDDIIAFNLASLSWIAASSDEYNYDSPCAIDRQEVSADEETTGITMFVRGGDSISTIESPVSTNNGDNDRPTLAFSHILDSLRSSLFNKLPDIPFLKNKDEQSNGSKLKQEQNLLSSTKVKSVSVPDSDILPPDVVTRCAEEANLIEGQLTPETLELTANMINRHYLEHGYVMNSVTGATLVPSSSGEGHVELKVREVRLANGGKRDKSPVNIRFLETINKSDSGEDEWVTLPSQSSGKSQSDNQSYKLVSGRTRPSKIARMTKLSPGSHFCIRPERWSQLAAFPGQGFDSADKQGKSAIFSSIHAVRPVPTSQENTVEVEITATENKPYVSLEYGVTKSLYSDQWEGELDLKHANTFGGGEVSTVNVRKGKRSGAKKDDGLKDWNKGVVGGPLNWRMSIKDDYLGEIDAGYDLEVFRDHVGFSEGSASETIPDDSEEENPEAEGSQLNEVADDDSSPLRTGASVGLRFPRTLAKINGHSMSLPKSLSARFEHVDPSAKNDHAQCMASMSTEIGPFNHRWNVSSKPLRSTVSATATAGGKWNARSKPNVGDDAATTFPYATGTITTQQMLPINSRSGSSPSANLIMRHVISAASRHVPRHETILLGLSSRIRGYKYNYRQPHMQYQPPKTQQKQEQQNMLYTVKRLLRGNIGDQIRPPIALSKSITGTVELRIPLPPSVPGGGTIVLFGDWCLSQAQLSSSLSIPAGGALTIERPFRHSSLGIGLRKVVQGLPLKMEACISEHGFKGLFFGIGT